MSKPHLKRRAGAWWCGPRGSKEFFLWACCAPTVREVCALWARLSK